MSVSLVITAIVIIGAFYLMTLVLGYGAAALVGPDRILAAPGGANSAAPLLALEIGGSVFMAVISAVAFATVLAVVAGLAITASASIAAMGSVACMPGLFLSHLRGTYGSVRTSSMRRLVGTALVDLALRLNTLWVFASAKIILGMWTWTVVSRSPAVDTLSATTDAVYRRFWLIFSTSS